MSKIVDILDELAATLRAAYSGSDVPVQVEGRLTLNPTAPSIDIYPGDPFSDPLGQGFGDVMGRLVFTVRARVNAVDHEAAQDLLIAFMDSEDDLSVAAALMDDQTLNGMAGSVNVEGPSGYIRYIDESQKGSLLGCEWKLTVLRAHS